MKDYWILDTVDEEIVQRISEELEVSTIVASILASKGYATCADAVSFLNPRFSSLANPFLLFNMYEAVDRVRHALHAKETVGIFADSDLDGLTSLSVIYLFFQKAGIVPFYRFPTKGETYGLTRNIIDEFIAQDVSLLITLDCGVRDCDEITYARQHNIDVVVCDHHEAGEILPDALILDPKQNNCSFPFKHLAGVGVAFKLCQALLYSYLPIYNQKCVLLTRDQEAYVVLSLKNGISEDDNAYTLNNLQEIEQYLDRDTLLVHYNVPHEAIASFSSICSQSFSLLDFVSRQEAKEGERAAFVYRRISESRDTCIMAMKDIFLELNFYAPGKMRNFINTVLPFVAIGTVADVMPLTGENRILLHYGLKAFQATAIPSLQKLKEVVDHKVTAKSIGWNIAPLLNTPGRFGRTELTLDFLLADNDRKHDLFEDIYELNKKRKKILQELYLTLVKDIQLQKYDLAENFIFVHSDEVPEGITGLLANKLATTFMAPVIVATELKETNMLKGSGRVTADFDFFSCIEPWAHLCQKIGGHAQAFGFSIQSKNIDSFVRSIDKELKNKVVFDKTININMELMLENIQVRLLQDIAQFEPFGHTNSEPVFLLRNVPIADFSFFGSSNEHGKYTFKHSDVIAVGWNMGKKMQKLSSKHVLDLVCTLEEHHYQNQHSLRLILKDFD